MLINIPHLIGAAKYSLAGIKRAWQGEQAFRHEVLTLPVMFVILFLVCPGTGWTAILMTGWFVVMSLELLNSAIEEVFDLISPEYNIHVKHGKDLASAAIFICVCLNIGLWVFMLCDVLL